MHLLEGVGDIEGRDLLLILEFEKLVSTVSSHVYEDIGLLIGVQPLRDWCIGLGPTCSVSLERSNPHWAKAHLLVVG